MPTGPVVASLGAHEGVDGPERLGVLGRDPDLAAPWERAVRVRDPPADARPLLPEIRSIPGDETFFVPGTPTV